MTKIQRKKNYFLFFCLKIAAKVTRKFCLFYPQMGVFPSEPKGDLFKFFVFCIIVATFAPV